MIIAEAVKRRYNSGKEPNLYFFRDRSQNEVDLLYPGQGSFTPIEIKSARTYRPDFTKGIRYFRELSNLSSKGILLYDGDLETESDYARILNFRNLKSLDF